MDNRLMEAAQVGDIDALYQLVDEKICGDTPLHIAAASGQTGFAMEVVHLMPSFLKKLNRSGLSPMHLALMNGNLRLVYFFLDVDPGLVRLKGRGGLTPLHYAAKYGNIDLLFCFLVACPESIEDVTVQGKTVFHIAAETDTIADVLEILVGWLRIVCHKDAIYWGVKLPNWKDEQGKTVLDMIEYSNSTTIDQMKVLGLLHRINARNSQGETVLDVLQRQTQLKRKVVTKMLMRRRRDHLNQELGLGFGMSIYIRRHRMRLSDEVVNALLVVAGLILAAIFPYVYNPPGGFRPTSNNNESAAVSLNCNNVTINSTLQYANITSNPNIINARVAMGQGSFAFATIFTDTLFCVVLSVISFLLPDGLFGSILFWLLPGFIYLYFFTIFVIGEGQLNNAATIFILVLLVLTTLTILYYGIGSWQVARLEARKYVLMKGISSEYLDAQERSTVAAAADPTGEDEDMEAVAQTIPSASS